MKECTFEYSIFYLFDEIDYVVYEIFEDIQNDRKSSRISRIKEIYGKSRPRFNVVNIFGEYMGNGKLEGKIKL